MLNVRNLLGGNWKKYFAIIISSKAFSSMGEEVDDQIIREADMPHWMDLDTLYVFQAENDKDESEFKYKTSASQLTVIEPVKGENIQGNFSFIVETKDKYNYYGTNFCKEMNRWVAALRKSKQTIEEISRTKGQMLTKNVDPIITLYRKKVNQIDVKRTDQVLKKCVQELTNHTSKIDIKKTELGEFLKIARAGQQSLAQVNSDH